MLTLSLGLCFSTAHLCAPLRSSPSVTACMSSRPLTLRWLPALWIHSLPTWPGETTPGLHCLNRLYITGSVSTPNGFTVVCVYFRINTPRKQGGLGPMKIPLLSDLTHQISKDYGVFLEDQGHTLRYCIPLIDFCLLQQGGILFK